MMQRIKKNFLFVVYPLSLITKGQYRGTQLPEYSFSVFRDQLRQDQITIIPTRQQKLYYNYFNLSQGQLQFNEQSSSDDWHQRKVVVYERGREIGQLQLNIGEYIQNYEDYNSRIYTEKIKIAQTITFEFEVFVAASPEELSSLLFQAKGQSNIKTPLTQSREEDLDLDRLLSSTKKIQSQIYTPKFPPRPSQILQAAQQSGQESVNTEPIAKKNDFVLTIREVPVRNISVGSSEGAEERSLIPQVLKQYWKVPSKEKLTLLLFFCLSLGMIYLSMQPVRRI